MEHEILDFGLLTGFSEGSLEIPGRSPLPLLEVNTRLSRGWAMLTTFFIHPISEDVQYRFRQYRNRPGNFVLGVFLYDGQFFVREVNVTLFQLQFFSLSHTHVESNDHYLPQLPAKITFYGLQESFFFVINEIPLPFIVLCEFQRLTVVSICRRDWPLPSAIFSRLQVRRPGPASKTPCLLLPAL